MDLALEYYPAPLIEHTDGGQAQRDIQAGIVFHVFFYPPVFPDREVDLAIFIE
jgi:hypothetical protein